MRQRRKLTAKARLWGWTKFFLFLILLVLIALTSGFVTFANNVIHRGPPATIPKADGIVVLTGKGGGRLETGAKLLADGQAERLLISGVNASVSREKVLKILALPDDLAECCVDLDYVAVDTIGNAQETASWAKALSYEHLILVTSAYHMPRAQHEIAATMGRIKITAYPVASDLSPKWWTDGKSMRRLLTEYSKLLLTLMRKSSDKNMRGAPNLEAEITGIDASDED